MLLGMGGLAGFALKGSTASLAGGLGTAGILSICATISLKYYQQGKLCRTATVVSLLITLGLSWMMYKRYSASGKMMPSGMVFFLSVGMSAFYVWNIFLGPKPPVKKVP